MISFLVFVLTVNLAPGPANAASAEMGRSHGYRNCQDFLLGMAVSFFVSMAFCGFLVSAVRAMRPVAVAWLQYAGSGLILFLAAENLDPRRYGGAGPLEKMGFYHGLVLQAMNPRTLVYGLVIYTSFLVELTGTGQAIATSAAILSLVAFVANSVWAEVHPSFAGEEVDERWLRSTRILTSLIMVYVAGDASGVL